MKTWSGGSLAPWQAPAAHRACLERSALHLSSNLIVELSQQHAVRTHKGNFPSIRWQTLSCYALVPSLPQKACHRVYDVEGCS